MKKALVLILSFSIFSSTTFGQSGSFSIAIEPVNAQSMLGLQSYAVGQANGKWLIIGGRIDGLHQRRPFDAFDKNGNNTQITVFDPNTQQKWSASIASLSVALQEQLQSTNMQFHQKENQLYLVGGYGYSATIDDHTTYASLIAIDVPATIDAIVNKKNITPYFRQINDDKLQVTGGKLGVINGNYYLVGGHKFIGRYNPMGPDRGPGFVQEYTNQIRIFNITDDGKTIAVQHLKTLIDNANLHRRDFNVTAQIFPDGEQGLTAFSGVFQHGIDLPFLNSINIDQNGYYVVDSFTQFYNHYHCPNIPVFSAKDNLMSTVFFGGIAQFYEENGTLVQDNNVPFVKTITEISRNAKGTMTEYKMPIEMPAFLGAGSEFIPNEALPRYDNGVFKLDDFVSDTTSIGFIYGGIKSPAPNVFWSNADTPSVASQILYKVKLIKNKLPILRERNKQIKDPLHLRVLPDVDSNVVNITYYLEKSSTVELKLLNKNGKKVAHKIWLNQKPGKYTFQQKIRKIIKRTPYLLSIKTGDETVVRKLIIEG